MCVRAECFSGRRLRERNSTICFRAESFSGRRQNPEPPLITLLLRGIKKSSLPLHHFRRPEKSSVH
jgi:hypothetical protein